MLKKLFSCFYKKKYEKEEVMKKRLKLLPFYHKHLRKL